MLSGELAKFLADIIQDYNQLEIRQLLVETITVLQNRNPKDIGSYLKQSQSIRERANNIIENNNTSLYPDTVKNLILSGPYESIYPSKIARIIIASVQDSFSNAAASGELTIYTNMIDEALSSFQNYISVSNKLGQTYKYVSDGSLKIELEVPTKRYDGDLGKLGKKLEQFDRFFSSASSIYNLSADKPTISSVSTGSFIADLVANADTIKAVLEVYALLLDCTTKMLDIYKSTKTLRESGVDVPEIDNRKVVEGLIAKSFESHFDLMKAEVSPDKLNEARVRLHTSCVFMIEEIQNGTKVSLSITSEEEKLALLTSTAGKAVEDTQIMIEDLNRKQQDITRKVDGEGPLPMLTGPSKESSE